MGGALAIRPGRLTDVPQLAEFQLAMAWETESKRLDPKVLTRGIEAVFEDPALGCYLVAERAGAVVGSLMLTYEWSDWRNGLYHWIQSVYTAPEARRTGVYRALYDHVLGEAEAREGVIGVRLYVEYENAVAQEAYEKLGMTRSSYHFYEVNFVLRDAGKTADAGASECP